MTATAAAPTATTPRRLFNVHEYHQMAEAGILDEDERIELIEGEIVEMGPVGGPHIKRINDVTKLLNRSLDDRAEVSPQNPVRLNDRSEPMPDIAVLRYRGDDEDVPVVGDVLVLIEISVSSLRRDLGWALALYARAGIPEVWDFDVNGQRLLRHAEPSEGQYRCVDELRPGDSISVPTIPDVLLAVADMLGKRQRP
ncbi:MAG: Uma2 family endonuclease [Chloroflexota bacterium]|nr:Uma2 family endonuclease [Chloroflexota bacterium]